MLVRGLLEHVARPAGLDHLEQVGLAGVHGQHEHGQVGALRLEPAQGLQPAQPGHADVQDDDVDAAGVGQGRHPLHGLEAVCRLADHHQVRLGVDQQAQARAQHGVVVGQEDPHPRPGRPGGRSPRRS